MEDQTPLQNPSKPSPWGNYFKEFLMLFPLSFLITCDPVRILVIKVSNPEKGHLAVYFNAPFTAYRNVFAELDKGILILPEKKNVGGQPETITKRSFGYGFGNWGKSAVNDLAQDRFDFYTYFKEKFNS